jgi:triosephosphate isomerase
VKKLLLGTNWKMHKTVEQAVKYTKELVELTREVDEFKIFIIPPYTDLWQVKSLVEGSHILFGAQNMHWEDKGAYTGEISPAMLKEIGIDIIELGHSERRQYYNETDFTVNKKVLTALKYDFTALICIGERLEEKESGTSQEVLARQVKLALKGVLPQQLSKIWIAYEPVWAIGENGIPAEPGYIGEIHTCIRRVLEDLYGEELTASIPVLYGGSVNIDNSLEFIRQPNVDGLFIGRSAWEAPDFYNIMMKIKAAIQ